MISCPDAFLVALHRRHLGSEAIVAREDVHELLAGDGLLALQVVRDLVQFEAVLLQGPEGGLMAWLAVLHICFPDRIDF